MIDKLIRNITRFLNMRPEYAVLRLETELWRRLDHQPAGQQEKQLNVEQLLKTLNQPTLGVLEEKIISQGVAYDIDYLDGHSLNKISPGSTNQIVELASHILDGQVPLLGSTHTLNNINWACDYRSGLSWPFAHYTKIDAADLDRASDVKFPWELSRMHWLIPVAQAYRLTADERYAAHIRDILELWLVANPCGWGVNWACAMEPAMRVLSWTWLYRNLHQSASWQEGDFRFRMLQALYLHLRFVRHNIEITDINGNHLIADAAALVVGGAFFGSGKPQRWQAKAWKILQQEINYQVLPDGVNFEASIPYHRFVTELFFLAAATLEQNNIAIPRSYVNKLLAMADYVRTYTKPDGNAPVIGDADDARALPLGQQNINDHRYLPFLIAARWDPKRLTSDWSQSSSECLWWWGPRQSNTTTPAHLINSQIFINSGNAVLRSGGDYIYIDSGKIGLDGRGGHGHNDCLSFEITLQECNLVVDPGCPTYTGDWQLRNSFRSTGAHSTPALKDLEINRFLSPRELWSFRDDAQGQIELWCDESAFTLFRGFHKAYRHIDPSAYTLRALVLDKLHHAIAWEDQINGVVQALMYVPLQLAPGITATRGGENWMQLQSNDRSFIIAWQHSSDWNVSVISSPVAPSYGVLCDAIRLEWEARTQNVRQLRCYLYPGSTLQDSHHFAPDTALQRALQEVNNAYSRL